MSFPSEFTYCPHCSQTLQVQRVAAIGRSRCPNCGWIQYRNPTVGVAVVLIEQDRLLIGMRRDGGWCIPCGHVEWDESVEEAAVREMEEETGIRVELDGVISVKSNFHDIERQTVGIWFRGHRVSGAPVPGDDLVKLAFVTRDKLPPLKFPTDHEVVSEVFVAH
jgi:8-oxo-dGTP diphosphatase